MFIIRLRYQTGAKIDNANVLCGRVSHFNLAVTDFTVDTVLFIPIAAMVIHREHGAPSTVVAVVMVMVLVMVMAKRWLP